MTTEWWETFWLLLILLAGPLILGGLGGMVVADALSMRDLRRQHPHLHRSGHKPG